MRICVCVFLQSLKSIEEKIEATAELLSNSLLLSTQHDVYLITDKNFQILLSQHNFTAPKKVRFLFVLEKILCRILNTYCYLKINF